MCVEFSLTSYVNLKYHCETKTRETFNFLHLVNNSVAIGLRFFINHINSNINLINLLINTLIDI